MKQLAEVPTTQLRIVVTIALIVVVVLAWLVACLFMGREQPGGLSETYIFLGALAGVDAAQFAAKRKWFQPSPPAGPDVEDAKAGATVPAARAMPRPDARAATVAHARAQLAPRLNPRGEAGTADDTTPVPAAPTPIPAGGP